jgi:hypothetical protein
MFSGQKKVYELLMAAIYCTNKICKDMQSGEHKTAGNIKLVATHITQQD